jgi:hypothetical protein
MGQCPFDGPMWCESVTEYMDIQLNSEWTETSQEAQYR